MWRPGIAVSLTIAAFVAGAAQGGDWPQILGPDRNGIAASDERLANQWPRGGPPRLWERNVGSGTAGVAVSQGVAVLFHRLGSQEIVEALDSATGRTLWKTPFPTMFVPQQGTSNGPLCVPVIHSGNVITFGAQGVLSCLDFKTGAVIWSRNTHTEYLALEGPFGAGSAPLVLEDRVIVNVGGARAHAGVVAFSLTSGAELWKRTDEEASYSSPIRVMLQDIPMVYLVTRSKFLLMDPRTGAIVFQAPFGKRGADIPGAIPIVIGDRMLVTGSQGVGALQARFDLFEFEKQWGGEAHFFSQSCTPIHLDNNVYVINGRDSSPIVDLRCVDLSTGALKWNVDQFGGGSLIAADGKMIAVLRSGDLVLIKPHPVEYQELSRARVMRGPTAALPALSDQRLLIRDDRTLTCLDVGDPARR